MISSQINRFMLLALLPVIGLIVYFEGQRYDPALIRFTSSEISSGTEAGLFPRQIGEFSRSGQVRVFLKENLYEYVNGHAEYFLSAGFERLAVGEYIQTGTEPGQPDMVVDIYDMGKGIQAFGVFTDEIGSEPSSLQIGMIGAKTPQGISFVNGRYYVKISSYRDTVPVDRVALRIDQEIGSSDKTLPAFSRLPDIGTVVSTRFIKEAYRGLDFANNVIERSYNIKDRTVAISLVASDTAEIRKLVTSYIGFFRTSEIEHIKFKRNGQELYKVIDPYEGDWYLIPFADALFGIYGAEDDETLDRLIISLLKTDTGK
jgi:hypothetical protein